MRAPSASRDDRPRGLCGVPLRRAMAAALRSSKNSRDVFRDRVRRDKLQLDRGAVLPRELRLLDCPGGSEAGLDRKGLGAVDVLSNEELALLRNRAPNVPRDRSVDRSRAQPCAQHARFVGERPELGTDENDRVAGSNRGQQTRKVSISRPFSSLRGLATRLSDPTNSRDCGGLGPVRGVDRHRLVSAGAPHRRRRLAREAPTRRG